MAVSQRPLSAAALTEKATIAGWKDLPAWYMVSEQDNAIPPDCKWLMAKRMNAEFSDRSDSENRLDLVLCVADMSATVADALWGGGSGGLGGAAVRLDAVVAEDAAEAIEFAVQLLVFGADGLDVCFPVGS